MASFLTKIFGSRNQRTLKAYGKHVAATNALEESFSAKSDEELRALTLELKQRIADGATLESVIPQAFAAVREASKRTLGMRPFDVQLIGGVTLNNHQIAEMRTGEGKTLVATLPAYLNALTGMGVHLVTVNEYLAKRDAAWMAPIYEFLGMSVGVIYSNQPTAEKRAAYEADITYGTNNEFGFDYLRDNLAHRTDDKVQRELNFAVVDEVDSILIDEARTPLIISGPSEDSPEMYGKINRIIPALKPQLEEDGSGDFTIDEKGKMAMLTEEGQIKAEQLLSSAGLLAPGESLYSAANISLMHYLTAGLRAHAIYKKDVEYIVKDGEIVIVDEFTGRTMPGRRWSDGLHQAIEAKEGVPIKQESQTYASITFQNYFRLYNKLSGMTGTADTEAFEFQQIYALDVVVIPTHRPMMRDDMPDLVYLTQKDKFAAIIEDIEECIKKDQPVLVGTTSIETSEYLAKLLAKKKIKHEVLNAKQHSREAEIVANAGRPGAVTIATNMAGRGTDIVLGGRKDFENEELDEDKKAALEAAWKKLHEQVLESGGLHIIGTERHESRRIDNQLRGRSGRQGDPGSSRFFLSMEDNLMRIFGDPERNKAMLSRVGMREGEAIESKLLTRQIEKAQRKVEAHNFDARKNLLEYDDVANEQRVVVYEQRNGIMSEDDMSEAVIGIRAEVIEELVEEYLPAQGTDAQWQPADLENVLQQEFGAAFEIEKWLAEDAQLKPSAVAERIIAQLDENYEKKVEKIGAQTMREFEKAIMLQQLDMQWKDHLAGMDHLRQGIHLRGYAQKNPKQEYKREAFAMFGEMLDRFKRDTTSILCRVQIQGEDDVDAVESQRRASTDKVQYQHASAGGVAGESAPPPPPGSQEPFVREGRKVGRNEPCPCGSGKKYKQCHGRLS
ncbi:MAG: preprotein translocase subunit SecA [Gammaproteobacteria bacterium]|nr:preprotein translocase subunit SecA [Gammaproteobacteria bacterium]